MASAPIANDVQDEQAQGPLDVLSAIASAQGSDISDMFDTQRLTKLGADVVRDYERDLADRSDWEDTVTEALEIASQAKKDLDDGLPEYRLSNKNFPILALAGLQFNARAYPAICKSGSIVKAAVIGSDKGRPQLDPQSGQPAMQPVMGPDGQPAAGPNGQPQMQPVWQIPPGAKSKRANRVADYLNVYIEYRMDDWEEDTDALLFQIAVAGCAFRKLWWDGEKQCAAYVPALDLVVPIKAKSLKTTPRITECIRDAYPYQLRQKMAAGDYRTITLVPMDDDEEAPRLLLEQHRLIDLDGDGLDEPYIITVDKETSEVLRIEANFSADDVALNQDGSVKKITPGRFYVKYPFLPNPKGEFYDIGFGQLLKNLGLTLDSTLDAMFDATTAQIAGGGFYAAGLRLQGNGQTSSLRWRPGEYKAVNMSGAALRDAIYDRTFPGASPIMFQLFELILGAAKEIASIKDVLTGEASNQGQVGTTLALIEQGLSVFTAIYKRIYRSLGEEFGLLYENLAKYGGDTIAQDYDRVLDDPEANFEKDFADGDMDIKPVADPTSVTKMQRVAKAQALLQFRGQGLNDIEIDKRALEALDVEDIDALMPDPNAPPPPEALKVLSEVDKNKAQTQLYQAQTARLGFDMGHDAGAAGAPEPMAAAA